MIGRSEGASVRFEVESEVLAADEKLEIEVFTTRPDTIFVVYMTLRPSMNMFLELPPMNLKQLFSNTLNKQKRSERDRMSDVKTVSGQFTGAT